ncbi:MAG: acetyl-CoA C-acyltransferase [Deltaproteobacteria bacterium HGW-Deltaproteobacteria-10]|nr:MAG: acetyl-CoA C-acyltransferase [Deltaproteobacteria bacterium HGW-Deltaproteobacteria-10]
MKMKDREVVFVKGMRTAFGKIGGSLKEYTAEELAGIGLKGLVEKTNICEQSRVDNVYMGMAFHPARAINPSRWALLYAGMPESTSASVVELQCGSAIDSINHAAWKIIAGQADIVIAGGMESFSQLPRKYSTSVEPYRLNTIKLLDFQLQPPSTEGKTYLPFEMGQTAENLADLYKISRQEQDQFAFRSQSLANKAIEAGCFVDEIIPVSVSQGKKKPSLEFNADEFPRLTSLEEMSALPPAFKKGGTVTAGNSSGLNDGSAFVLMMTREKALQLGYEPMAKWICSAEWGVDPAIMGVAPAYALPIAMKRAGLKLSDFAVVECNEAFAVQNLAVIRELENQTGEKANMDNWNPNGGAIAFGHANGASGARIAMLCMKELIRRGGRFGTFCACCGGGQGVVTIIENLQR